MSEKKGGAKVVAWICVFLLVIGLGWFGLTKFSSVQKQQNLANGESVLVTLVVGDVEVKRMGSSDWTALYVDDELQMGDEMKTADNSYCEFQLINRGIFRLEGGSEIALSQLENIDGDLQSVMTLNAGSVALKPQELGEGETFRVETTTAIAAVRGTRFSVSVNDSGDTSIAVVEGEVAVTPHINAVNEAADRGLVSAGASGYLQSQLVNEMSVTSGEELNVNAEAVENLDAAIAKAVEEVAAESGPITEETLGITAAQAGATTTVAAVPSAPVEVVLAVRSRVETQVSSAPAVQGTTYEQYVAIRQTISQEARAVLDQVTEDRIIQNVVEIVKLTVNSQPQGARVMLDGRNVGTTPYVQIVEKNTEIALTISMDGYKEYAQTYKVDVNNRMSILAVLESLNAPTTTTVNAGSTAADMTTTTAAQGANPDQVVVETTTTLPQVMPGDLLWNKPIAFISQTSDPIYYRGNMFATSGNKLYVISPNGVIIKTVTVIPEGTLTKPSAGDGLVFVGSGSGGVWAFDTEGNKVWSKTDAGIEMLGSVSPVAGYGIVAVASIDKGIMVYDSQSGSLIMKIAESQQIFSKPLIVNDGKILVYAVESGEVVGYDLSAKAEIWRKKYANRMAMPILGNDNAAVVLDRDLGKFIGINPNDGSQIWEKTLSALAKTAFYPVYSGGKIAIISQAANKLYVLLSKTGDVILAKTAEGISSYPFMSGNWVYIGTRGGEVLGFNYNTDASWSMKIDGPVAMVTADDNGVYALSASSIFSFAK